MLLIVLSIFGGILALTGLFMATLRRGTPKGITSRLAALDQEFTPTRHEEAVTDIRKDQKKLSAIPWLNHWLSSLNLSASSGLYLYQAGVTVSLGTLVLTSLAGSGALGVILYGLGIRFPLLLAALGFLVLPFFYVRSKRSKRLLKLEQQLPEALDTMVSAIRVGHSFNVSLGSVAQDSAEPISGEMRRCFDEQNFGIDLRTALLNLTKRAPIQDFRIFVAAVMIQKESGGNLAEVLEKVSETTRERFRLKKQVMVHTAQGRLTGWILSILPIALGLGMYFMNPDTVSVLWTSSVGVKMLCAAAAMETIGALIIRRIVHIRV